MRFRSLRGHESCAIGLGFPGASDGAAVHICRDGKRLCHVRQYRGILRPAGFWVRFPADHSGGLCRQRRACTSRSSDRHGDPTIAYLPGLIWALSRNKLGKFDRSESIAAAIGPQMHRSFVYRLLLRPLNSGPDVLGYPLLLCSTRLLARFLSIWDLVAGESQRRRSASYELQESSNETSSSGMACCWPEGEPI